MVYPGGSEHIAQMTESGQRDFAFYPRTLDGSLFYDEDSNLHGASVVFQEREKLISFMKAMFPAYQLKMK